MPINRYPKWLSWTLCLLSIITLSSYATMELMFDKEIEFYRYALTFIFGLMFYNMANKKEE
jgi:hypothetical protein